MEMLNKLPLPQIVKDHPYITLGAVAAGVLIFWIVSASGSNAAVSSDSLYGNADNMAAINAQVAQTQATLDASNAVNANNNATAITLAQISADAAKYGADVAVTQQENDISYQEQIAAYSLQANSDNLNTQLAMAGMDYTLQTQQQNIDYDLSLDTISANSYATALQIQADVTKANLASQTAIATTTLAANASIATANSGAAASETSSFWSAFASFIPAVISGATALLA